MYNMTTLIGLVNLSSSRCERAEARFAEEAKAKAEAEARAEAKAKREDAQRWAWLTE